MIREAIEILTNGVSLSIDEASIVMREVMDGESTSAQLAAFLVALRIKGETPEEIAGMATIMRERALRVEIGIPLVDTAGTGGDGKGTFNISTAAAFVAAAAGLKVAKHGNRGATSKCGSADVLEALGVKIDLPPDGVRRCIEEVGIGFMFAPIFHPAMKHAASVRRDIGIRTVFNILGPLTNPAGANHQLLGVADFTLGDKMARVLRLLGTQRALVVHGNDGMDEFTLGTSTQVWEVYQGEIRTYTVNPIEIGLPTASSEAMQGGTAEENAGILTRLFDGEQGPLRDVVVLNGAATLVAGEKAEDIKQGIQLASEAIDTGKAAESVSRLVKLSQTLGQGAA